jgi:hypothetical protein
VAVQIEEGAVGRGERRLIKTTIHPTTQRLQLVPTGATVAVQVPEAMTVEFFTVAK